MNTAAVYHQFQTPSNLQEHMLRVASLAEMILDHWVDKPLNAIDIVQACLFHDIAKPMNFDLTKQAQFGLSQAAVIKLSQLQERLRTTYGTTEHEAVLAMCREVGCTSRAVELIDTLEWSYAEKLLNENDIESLLPIYCDMRVGPHGLLSLANRLSELRTREHNSENMDNLMRVGLKIENMLQKKVDIDLNKITNEEVNQRINALQQLKI